MEDKVEGKEKATEFAQKLKALQKEYENDCELYAANAVQENGDVIPTLKIRVYKNDN